MIDKNLLKNGIEKIGLFVSENQLELMDAYSELLVEKNKVMNLTRVTDPKKIVSDHFIDSLSLLYEIGESKKILDIGTGAGFPGVPIAVMCPECHITMMDSTGKKINFVKDACEKLNINNVSFIVGRAEEYGRYKNLRESFEFVCARAVSDMKILAEISIPFVKVGGKFVAMKSADYKEELQKSLNTIKNLGGKVLKTSSIIIPNTNIKRTLISVLKTEKTSLKYPREYKNIVKKM